MKKQTVMMFLGLVLFSLIAQAAPDNHGHWQANNSRLFTSPIERTKLDSMRQAASAAALQAQETQKEPEAETALPLPPAIVMQGYLKRNDGKKSTVWINHQALQENGATGDVQIGSISNHSQQGSHELLLKLPSNGQKFKLKAGQRYLPDENRVVDVNAARTSGQDEK